MPGPSDQGAPPLPPEVKQQQQPLQQYGAMQQGSPQGATQQVVGEAFKGIAEWMEKLAKVIQVERPELMPILTRMAGMGKVLEQQYKQQSQGQGSPKADSEPPQPQQPAPEASAAGM